MSDAWSDDAAFKNLAKNKGLGFHRLSYECFSLNCIKCDGKIHYKLKKEVKGFKGKIVDGKLESKWHGPYRSAETGEMVGEKEFEELQETSHETHSDWYEKLRRAREETLTSQS